MIVSALASAQVLPSPRVTRLTAEAFETHPRIPINTQWKYSVDDDPRFADPAFDDTAWEVVDAFCPGQQMPPGWNGRGWFRFHLEIEPEVLHRRIAVFAYHFGAYELYVDGHLIATKGDVDRVSAFETPRSLRQLAGFTEFTRPDTILAVRFGTPPLGPLDSGYLGGGFWLEVGEPTASVQSLQAENGRRVTIHGLFIGMALAIGLLHLFLYWFVDDQRAHGDYAIFTLSTAGLTCAILLQSFDMSVGLLVAMATLFRASLVLLAAFGVRFFRTLKEPPESTEATTGRWSQFYFWSAVPVLLLSPFLSIIAVYVFVTVGLVFMVSYLASIARAKRPGIIVVLVGGVAMVIASLLQMAPEVMGVPHWLGTIIPVDTYISGFTVLLISMSLYLARNVGHTHRALAARVHEVELLSEAHLEQQKKAQEDEMARMRLQAENERQGALLEEAEKREALLKQLKRINRELHDTQAHLVQSEKMASLGQLVAGIAHEINTPVGAIHSMHDSLERASNRLTERLQALTPEHLEDRTVRASLKVLEDSIEVIRTGSERVARIVQRLRTFARLDEAELTRADIHEGLDDTLLLLRHKLKNKVAVRRDYGTVPPLACYPGQLNQVFMNLLVNARQAIIEAGTITIRTRSEPGWVVVDIQDDGCGIEPEHLSRIFDPGFTTKGVRVGTGLGLAICYRIVQAHYGSIDAQNVAGGGTTFTVKIPTDLEERLRTPVGSSPGGAAACVPEP